jgi:hypothetical protein
MTAVIPNQQNCGLQTSGRFEALFPKMRQTPADQFIGSRTRLRQQILLSNALPGLVVDHGKLHRMSGFSIHKFERWPRVSGNRPLVAHLQQRLATKKTACWESPDGVSL